MSLIMITMQNKENIARKVISFGLPLILLFLTSCESEEGKEFASFFIGFIVFLAGTVVVGIPGIVFSAISISSNRQSVPILAIVFTALYLVFFVIMMNVFMQGGSAELDDSIVVFPIINMTIIIMNIIFIAMGYKKRKNQPITSADNKDDLLDDIVEEQEEDLI